MSFILARYKYPLTMDVLKALTVLFLASCVVCAIEPATIQGYVRDRNTGESRAGVKVELYSSDDHTNVVSSTETDDKGFYMMSVEAGRYYDVYLRVGDVNPNQRTPEIVSSGGSYAMNFNIVTESSYSDSVVEKYGFGIVVAVALLVLAIIVFDKLLSRRTHEPSVDEMKRERDEIKGMLDVAREKYHRREIDEESFREITRDEQQRLIQLEAKISKKEKV